MSTHPCKHGGGVLLYRYNNVRTCALPCRSQLYSTRTPLVAVIVLFYAHALVQARRWCLVYRYSNVHGRALPCRSQLYSTRTPLVAVIVLFLCSHTRASTAVIVAIVMCTVVHFLAARNCTQREHRLSRLSFFFMSTHSCKHGGGHKKEHSHK